GSDVPTLLEFPLFLIRGQLMAAPGNTAAIATGLEIARVTPAISTDAHVDSEATGRFPPSYDLPGRVFLSDQQHLACCVSAAFAAALGRLRDESESLSPLFHYFVTRTEVLGGTASQMTGLSLEDGSRTLADFGVCRLSLHSPSMDAAGAAQAPDSTARTD